MSCLFVSNTDKDSETGEDSNEDSSKDSDKDNGTNKDTLIDEDNSGTSKKCRCNYICPKTKMRCLKEKHESGVRHTVTPKGFLSFSTFERIMKGLSSGTVKSLAGLDDIDVYKGGENFEKMRALIDIFAAVGEMKSPDEEEMVLRIKKAIDDTELFHKTDFPRHLNLHFAEDIAFLPKCTCLKCGMRHQSERQDCELAGRHTDPCSKCQSGFEVIEEIHELHKIALDKVKSKGHPSDILLDDLNMWKLEIQEVHTNFEEYRAHLAHKHDEATSDSLFYKTLKPGECIAIWDYKMKVLPAFFVKVNSITLGKEGSVC